MKISLKTSSAWSGVGEIHVRRYPFILGRQEDIDCALPFVFVSRRHCQLTVEDKQVFIQDLKSQNGTFVNGRRIAARHALQHGDQIGLGPLNFLVVTESAAVTATLPDFSSLHSTSVIVTAQTSTDAQFASYRAP
jgi:pSer/pThr/pTyr-binding forkhead associated (FHA) protein